MSKREDATFAERLKLACEHADVPWSPTKIGYLINENKQTVSNWMNEGMLPRADTLFRITDALGCDPRWLAIGDGPKPGDEPGRLASGTVNNSTSPQKSRLSGQAKGKIIKKA